MPGTDHVVSQHPGDELGTGASVKTGDGEVKSGDQVLREGQAKKDELTTQGQQLASNGASAAQE